MASESGIVDVPRDQTLASLNGSPISWLPTWKNQLKPGAVEDLLVRRQRVVAGGGDIPPTRNARSRSGSA